MSMATPQTAAEMEVLWERDGIDEKAAAKKQDRADEQIVEASKWQNELDTLMDRARHPRSEDVDLDTGRLATPESTRTLAIKSTFSVAEGHRIEDLLSRKDMVLLEISDLLNTQAETPEQGAYAEMQANNLKCELADTMLTLYELLTANPLITKDYLESHPESYCPDDLNTLINYYLERRGRVVAQVRGFRQQQRRRGLGRVPKVDGHKLLE